MNDYKKYRNNEIYFKKNKSIIKEIDDCYQKYDEAFEPEDIKNNSNSNIKIKFYRFFLKILLLTEQIIKEIDNSDFYNRIYKLVLDENNECTDNEGNKISFLKKIIFDDTYKSNFMYIIDLFYLEENKSNSDINDPSLMGIIFYLIVLFNISNKNYENDNDLKKILLYEKFNKLKFNVNKIATELFINKNLKEFFNTTGLNINIQRFQNILSFETDKIVNEIEKDTNNIEQYLEYFNDIRKNIYNFLNY